MRISDWSSDVCSSDLALDAFLDLKTRDDPLIQASARHTHAYLSQGRHGLKALHGIPVRNFRTLLSIKTRRPLGEDLRRQVEEQDRKSVVSGTSGSGRLSLGGRRDITKKTTIRN